MRASGQAGIESLGKRDARKLDQRRSEARFDLERLLQRRGRAAQLVTPQHGLDAGDRPKRRVAEILLGQREAIPWIRPPRLEFDDPFELACGILEVAAPPEFTEAQREKSQLEVQQGAVTLDLAAAIFSCSSLSSTIVSPSAASGRATRPGARAPPGAESLPRSGTP